MALPIAFTGVPICSRAKKFSSQVSGHPNTTVRCRVARQITRMHPDVFAEFHEARHRSRQVVTPRGTYEPGVAFGLIILPSGSLTRPKFPDWLFNSLLMTLKLPIRLPQPPS